jgi:hypothetical protein
MTEYQDDFTSDTPEGEVVHWMNRRPMRVGAAGLSTAVAGAFMLGAVAALGLVLLNGRFRPVRRPDSRFSRYLH